MHTPQLEIDQANMAFWDELCGSTDAQSLGITDSSPQTLKLFDDWYMDFYPYLENARRLRCQFEGGCRTTLEFNDTQAEDLCRDFRTCQINKENIASEGWLKALPRATALRHFAPFLGLAVYACVEK